MCVCVHVRGCVCVCVMNLQSVRNFGQLSFKMKTKQVANGFHDFKGFPSGTCEANYVNGNVIYILCTKNNHHLVVFD